MLHAKQNKKAFIVHCLAHWTEGNTHYLIGRVSPSEQHHQQQQQQSSNTVNNNNNKSTYKCLVYSETPSSSSNSNNNNNNNNGDPFGSRRRSRRGSSSDSSSADLVDFAANPTASEYAAYDTSAASTEGTSGIIQLSVAHDEFCRTLDGLGFVDASSSSAVSVSGSLSFRKVHGSRTHVAPPPRSVISIKRIRQSNTTTTATATLQQHSHRSNKHARNGGGGGGECKFPRWLNKRWHDLKQTKTYTLDYKMDSLLVVDEKNSVVINQYTCAHMRVKRSTHVQAVVKSLNGW